MAKVWAFNQAPLAVGIFGLGVVGLKFQDFALQWQSAPDWIKAVPFAALISAVWLILTGVALVIPRLVRWGGISALVQFGTWSLIFHGSLALKQPDQAYVWLDVCEVGSLSIAGLACLGSTLTNPVQIQGVRLASRIGFGLCAIVFGLCHFVYSDVTAAMVPAWLGIPHVWAGLTGAGHLAAGLALISGVQARLAAGIEAAMCGAFVLLLHVPRAVVPPASQMEWTMLCIAMAIGGATWVVRSQVTVNT